MLRGIQRYTWLLNWFMERDLKNGQNDGRTLCGFSYRSILNNLTCKKQYLKRLGQKQHIQDLIKDD